MVPGRQQGSKVARGGAHPSKHGSACKAVDGAVDDEVGDSLWAFVAAWADGRIFSTNLVKVSSKRDVASDDLGDEAGVLARKGGE